MCTPNWRRLLPYASFNGAFGIVYRKPWQCLASTAVEDGCVLGQQQRLHKQSYPAPCDHEGDETPQKSQTPCRSSALVGAQATIRSKEAHRRPCSQYTAQEKVRKKLHCVCCVMGAAYCRNKCFRTRLYDDISADEVQRGAFQGSV